MKCPKKFQIVIHSSTNYGSYTSPELTQQKVLKLTKVELKLLTNFEMLLVKEEGIREGTWHAFH